MNRQATGICGLAIMVAGVFFCVSRSLAQADATKTDKADIAAANNAFAADLYGRLAGGKGNLFFSPQSIHCALGMTYAGAKGATAEQMAKTLHFGKDPEKTHAGFADLVGKINASGRGPKGPLFELAVANSLWGQQGFDFLPAFTKIAGDQYGAKLSTVDFVKKTEEARNEINAWVEKQTHDKIKDLIKPGFLDRSTRLVLANAIYFKGSWAEKFQKAATKNLPFRITADKTVDIPMMNQRRKFGYAENAECQVLDLPYAGQRLSMLVVLPRKVDGLAAIEKTLDGAKLAKSLGGLRSREVQATLPRFKLTCEFSLADQLKALGMTDAFSDKADFSGMSAAEQLAISAVVHKAFVDVNEEGTEAAAATGVGMACTSVAMPEEPVIFKADHPFMFMIRHNESGAILFMGRVVEP